MSDLIPPTSSLLSVPISNLEAENQMLIKLIHRNFNQHRSTKVFSNLHKASKIVKMLPSKDIAHLTSQAERYLRMMQNPKVNARDLTASLQCAQQLCKAVAISAESVIWFSRTARLLKPLLLQLLFVPLYTVFLGVTARSLQSLSSIILHFDSQLQALKSQIQHISSVNRRHAPLVDTITPHLKYDEVAMKVLGELRLVYGPNADSNKPKGGAKRDGIVSGTSDSSSSSSSSSSGSSSSSSGSSSSSNNSSSSGSSGESFLAAGATPSSVPTGPTSDGITDRSSAVLTAEYEVRADEDYGEVIGRSRESIGVKALIVTTERKEMRVEKVQRTEKAETISYVVSSKSSSHRPIAEVPSVPEISYVPPTTDAIELFEDIEESTVEIEERGAGMTEETERKQTHSLLSESVTSNNDLVISSLTATSVTSETSLKKKKMKRSLLRTPDTSEKKKKKMKKDSIDDIFGDL